MYQVGNAFHEAARGNNRQIVVRATFDDNIVVDGSYIQNLTITDAVNNGTSLTLGNTCSKTLTLNMYMPNTLTAAQIRSAKIFIEIGFLSVTSKLNALDTQLYVDEILGYLYQNDNTDGLTFSLSNGNLIVQSEDESISVTLRGNKVVADDSAQNIAQSTFWLPMGVFYVDKAVTQNDYLSISITAYDGMALIDQITENFSGVGRTEPTAPELIEEIASAAGVACSIPSGLPNANVGVTRTAYVSTSYRNTLGYFASFLGCNATFTRTGALTVKPYAAASFNILRTQQYIGGLTKTNDDALTIRSVSCQSAEKASELSQKLYFSFGYWDESQLKFVNDFLRNLPRERACFYSGLIPVIPGKKYTLTRTNTDLSTSVIHVFGYVANHHGLAKYREDESEFIDNYQSMSYESRSMDIQLKSTVTDVRYIRICVIDANYRTETAGASEHYLMSNSYTLTRESTENIQLGAGYGISFISPLIYNAELLQPIYNYYNGVSYLPCSVKYRGDPSIDAGDIITVEDRSGQPVNIVVASQEYKISGGMNCTITSSGSSDSDSSVSAAARYSGGVASPSSVTEKLQARINDLEARVSALEG